ncbi:protein of unknown function [Petrocella atlantisensis]|uniref:Uncharacterized protein n=1 Tax=Petrocella atlantisensis TaxID=2173034 RepID=A0A3P7PY80_9FIRM|nr:protein of unknown function [Petrocella atlantisensis]
MIYYHKVSIKARKKYTYTLDTYPWLDVFIYSSKVIINKMLQLKVPNSIR